MPDRKESAFAPDVRLGTTEGEVAEYADSYMLRASDTDAELLLPTPTASRLKDVTLFVIRGDDGTSGHEARVKTENFPIRLTGGEERNVLKLEGFEVVRLYVLNARWYVLGSTSLPQVGDIETIGDLATGPEDASSEVRQDLQTLWKSVNQIIDLLG